MKALFWQFIESHERDILWLLFACTGWGLAFWYMPAELRSVIFADATLLVQSTAAVFLLGLLFRRVGILHWLIIGMALSLLFGEHTRHSLLEGSAIERIATVSVLLGLMLASKCPSWNSIRGYFSRFKNAEVSR